jgi:hypothetical protein
MESLRAFQNACPVRLLHVSVRLLNTPVVFSSTTPLLHHPSRRIMIVSGDKPAPTRPRWIGQGAQRALRGDGVQRVGRPGTSRLIRRIR